MPRALMLIFRGLLGAVVLGYPLFLSFAVLLASLATANIATYWFYPWGLLLAASPLLVLLILAVVWLRRPAEIWRFHGAFLLGGVLGGAFWFSRFGLAGLV
ncbi:hypothetical protein QOL99_07935 [Deinococcus sp. MIMF12]|uniref:Uncharacterized protein n=1 Tax=Deinococcus rhizophilus TaxID=3049544 RepID=A0ABT7JGC0_9DEIO|nr:hypothetical protein [Deinococcus rhizophilus]MDL2344080.1 hypothetical protein [Deinococcus rhizophilus]